MSVKDDIAASLARMVKGELIAAGSCTKVEVDPNDSTKVNVTMKVTPKIVKDWWCQYCHNQIATDDAHFSPHRVTDTDGKAWTACERCWDEAPPCSKCRVRARPHAMSSFGGFLVCPNCRNSEPELGEQQAIASIKSTLDEGDPFE